MAWLHFELSSRRLEKLSRLQVLALRNSLFILNMTLASSRAFPKKRRK
jgi:hypothetical protein